MTRIADTLVRQIEERMVHHSLVSLEGRIARPTSASAVYLHIQAHKEGPRAYVERLVLHDIELAGKQKRSKCHDTE